MTTFNTGNPLGSTDVYDRYDNSENLDNFSNGPLDAYPDRFGVSRQSLQGIRNASQYQVLGAYAAGLQITALNQAFSYLGEYYVSGPSIVLPYTTTGIGAAEIANFRPVGDAILRSDLSNIAADKGASIISGASKVVSSIAALRLLLKTVASKNSFAAGYYTPGDGGGGSYYLDAADTTSADNGGTVIVSADGGRWKLAKTTSISVRQFGAKGDGVTNDTAAIQACATAVGYGGTMLLPTGTYFVSATITLRGATKLLGDGVEATIVKRTGDYGDTFVCGTSADQSEPARSFEARKIRFQHSDPYVSGSLTMPNKATYGSHLRIYGAQEAIIEDCWFWRLPYNVVFEGGSWVKVIRCQFLGVFDASTPATQEGLAQLYAKRSSIHGNPTTWVVTGCNFLGATIQRNITYAATSGSAVVNRIDTIGSQFGFFIDGLEDADISGNYFGGQSVAELGVVNAAGGGVIDIRISRNFFDGISLGAGILFAPSVSGTLSLAVTIDHNIFTDNLHAVFINQNAGDGLASVVNLSMTGNIALSGIGTQLVLAGARGFTATGNSISDYNKHAISTTDPVYTAGIWAYSVSANGTIQNNTLGGGGNSLINDIGANFCYSGVLVDSALTSVVSRNNWYSGIRSGSTFSTGPSSDENQVELTATGNYLMQANDAVVVVKKTAAEATVVQLPANPVKGRNCTIKDGKGDAATNQTIIGTPDGKTIDGAASINITTNYGYMTFRFNGTQWNRVG